MAQSPEPPHAPAPGPPGPRPPALGPLPWLRLVAGGAGALAVVLVAWEVALAALPGLAGEQLRGATLAQGVTVGIAVGATTFWLVARPLREARQRLGAALAGEARLRVLLESVPDAVLLVDAEGRLGLANPQAERVFGYRRDELAGKPASRLLPDIPRALDASQPEGVVAAGLEMEGVRKAGDRFPVEVSVRPIEVEGAHLAIAVVRDVTERRRLAEERTRAAAQVGELERLKEVSAFKTRFINMAAHELGTPLTPLRVQVHLLKGAELGPAARKSVAILERNVERLSELVAEILEVSRLEAGRLGVARAPIDLNQVVLEAVESYQEPARLAGIGMETRLTPGIAMEGDAKRITQVLFNLLGNALKFTQAGGSVVVETSGRDGMAFVRVRDTGAGLRAEDIGKLFQPFSQVHDTSQRTRAGTGLGLYVSRGLVELHGGRMWAESDGPGRGSTFAFALPLRAGVSVPAQVVPRPPPTRAEDLAKRARELV